MSITWTMLTSLSFLSTRVWTHEEPAQSSVLRRVELPQVEGPLLTREDSADEHNLDYIDKLELLVHQGLDAFL